MNTDLEHTGSPPRQVSNASRAWMGFALVAVLLISLAAWAADPKSSRPPPATSNLIILCTNGADFSASTAVFRSEVRVLDPQMYMECELLTVHFQTNTSSGASGGARLENPALTNASSRIEMIVAETNFLMMARDTTIIGDRAVYTASNEVCLLYTSPSPRD